ncbi:hypothetical protein BGW36DRAFT_372105 [Talaromyces proteolyticus]|uniref:Uncharacterized protein n=1 Tax=Talaromyces proteolyticus TaxID=1131652 RepID=A0AAD4KYB2_9EURO|nr:uncharacterized protein BGW36DRAFT_372105 [Talaromyces proteolyticus]KAH8702048.1 hypothetical protein BGW36DRAFT_372105 [Talaromyces proteolyticus]
MVPFSSLWSCWAPPAPYITRLPSTGEEPDSVRLLSILFIPRLLDLTCLSVLRFVSALLVDLYSTLQHCFAIEQRRPSNLFISHPSHLPQTSNMASPYLVVEPHPSVPNTRRPALHTSRGGAGNVISLRNTRTTESLSATGPASLTRLDSRLPTTFKSGRGGAGNVHSSSERAIFSFDEELEREMRREKGIAPVFHVGRGGAGNMIFGSDQYGLERKNTSNSASSNESLADRAKEKARTSLERTWSRLTGHQ